MLRFASRGSWRDVARERGHSSWFLCCVFAFSFSWCLMKGAGIWEHPVALCSLEDLAALAQAWWAPSHTFLRWTPHVCSQPCASKGTLTPSQQPQFTCSLEDSFLLAWQLWSSSAPIFSATHPVGCHHAFSNEVWTPALRRGHPLPSCPPLITLPQP